MRIAKNAEKRKWNEDRKLRRKGGIRTLRLPRGLFKDLFFLERGKHVFKAARFLFESFISTLLFFCVDFALVIMFISLKSCEIKQNKKSKMANSVYKLLKNGIDIKIFRLEKKRILNATFFRIHQ